MELKGPSSLFKVLVTPSWPREGLVPLQQYCHVTVHESEALMTQQEFLKAVPGFDGLCIIPHFRIDKEALDAAGPQLKVIGTASAGLGHIDLEECKKRGVKVGYVGETVTKAVAEMTVSLTLAGARRFKEATEAVRNGTWGTKWEDALWMCGKQICGSVVGIVGLGRIGLATAKRLASFEPSKILYCGHSVKPYAQEVGAEFVSFEQLVQSSDFVVATCSVDETNLRLFDAIAFSRMKPDAVFVNVTRGTLVDQDALYDALSTHRLGAACLDVTTPEPLPVDHKLHALKNCLITPHLGSATHITRQAMCSLTADNILAGLQGRPLPSPAPGY